MDRLRQDRSAPPKNPLAESMVLSRLLLRPSLIDRYDLTSLLVMPQHQWMWRAMVEVHSQQPTLDYPAFYLAWIERLRAEHPDDWQEAAALLDTVSADESVWRNRQYWSDPAAGTAEFDMGQHWHGLDWWYQRLRDCAEARKGIDLAQRIAERYWRLDLEGARTAVQSMPKAEVERIEIP